MIQVQYVYTRIPKHTSCNLSFIVINKGVLKVKGSHVYFKSGSIWKTVLDRDIVTTVHKPEVIYGLSKSSNCDDFGCIYFKVICRLQSLSNGIFRSCKISTDKCIMWFFYKSRVSTHFLGTR